jgi:integrase
MLRLLFYSAVRGSELVRIRVEDVDTQARRAWRSTSISPWRPSKRLTRKRSRLSGCDALRYCS